MKYDATSNLPLCVVTAKALDGLGQLPKGPHRGDIRNAKLDPEALPFHPLVALLRCCAALSPFVPRNRARGTPGRWDDRFGVCRVCAGEKGGRTRYPLLSSSSSRVLWRPFVALSLSLGTPRSVPLRPSFARPLTRRTNGSRTM